MKYYPINIDIRGKVAIIVGGGAVAERKCRMLLEAGAEVTVISSRLSRGLRRLLEKGCISHRARDYRRGDLDGAFLVFAATGNRTVSSAVAEEASEWRILANIADMPERSDFTTPAAVARGDLLLTVSTGGKCPVLAREVREELNARYGEEYSEVLRILGAVREKLLASKKGCYAMKEILDSLISHNLPGIVRGDSPDSVDRLLREIAGPGFSLSELGLEKRKSE
jgi:precorrin-2 dehydrogenase/sirohydrochlorin ferrochelatase